MRNEAGHRSDCEESCKKLAMAMADGFLKAKYGKTAIPILCVVPVDR
jgi:hypothetical protein